GLLLWGSLGCSGGDGGSTTDGGNGGSDGRGTSIDAGSTPIDAAASVDARSPVDCSSLTALPITATNLTGFSGSEDFAFDAEGNLASNRDGNVTKQPKTGASSLFSPNIGSETAGTRYLSNGDLIIAQVENGELLRIRPNGSSDTILTGIAYPNGVEVDRDDFVYVAEHDAGRIRRVNPNTGAFTVIATGLTNPNGLSFSPDYKTLYVNSFGGGTIHKITVDAQGAWSSPELLGDIFDGSGGPGGQRGGLDGMAVDACGNVYVTEFEVGFIWRFTPEGLREKVIELPSFWIPNMHWGSGIGGWDETILYVMDRDEGRLFELDLGISEKERVFP
ncbi:MAG: SMP-30/gluconolactonase/LRE family protein, partial [Kofleriaceae bacterium]|nr:SMP-30/gluconolactonase/LRE family protein [Kofleriaceae bacterium]